MMNNQNTYIRLIESPFYEGASNGDPLRPESIYRLYTNCKISCNSDFMKKLNSLLMSVGQMLLRLIIEVINF